MEFELKEQITGNIIDDAILRVVDDIDYHRNPDDRYMGSFKHLPTPFVKSTYELFGSISDNKKIGVLVDNDADGFTASSLLYRFITTNLKYHNIAYIITEGKTHGLSTDAMKEVYKKDIEFLIIPDAASNDKDQIEELIDNNINVLVLDHHEVNIKDVPSVVINNQLLEGVNKNFTGVGMVYLFCKIYCNEFLSRDVVDKYLDLVALGQTGDVSDISDPEIRYLAYTGVKNIDNPFIKAVMERKSIENPTTRDWSFSIISMINAVARIGTVEEKKILINAFTQDTNETVTITKKKKNKSTGKFDKIEEEVSMYTNMVLECEKIKRRQDKMVKDAMNNIEILQDEVVVLAHSQGTPTAINGLIAMKLADKYKKPVLVTNNIYGDDIKGSARCPYDFDFKQYLLDSYLMNYAQGHAQAFGWSISIDNFEGLQHYFNRHPINHNPIHYVDKVFTKPEESDIIQVEVNKHIYGGKVEYAQFAYTGVSFNKFCINKRGSMLTLFDNGVTFVMFNATDKLYEELLSNMKNNFVSVDIVGEPRLSSFTGKTRTEVIIKDIEIAEKYENEFGIDF